MEHGFDVNVADAIAGELRLSGRVSAVASNDFATTDWDVLLPGGTRAAPTGASTSDPYAYWPIWLAAGAACSFDASDLWRQLAALSHLREVSRCSFGMGCDEADLCQLAGVTEPIDR